MNFNGQAPTMSHSMHQKLKKKLFDPIFFVASEIFVVEIQATIHVLLM